MRIISLLLMLISLSVLYGCLEFGEDEVTTMPTVAQVERCRAEMYLNSSIEITPLGYKVLGSGIDDVIWFKFKTNSDVSEIFDIAVVNVKDFEDGFLLPQVVTDLNWWDITGKKLYGGKIALPYVRYMSVGIEKSDDDYIVYILWHET